MDDIFLTVYLLIGFLLRLGIPLGVTLVLGWILRRMDARWREEARNEGALQEIESIYPITTSAGSRELCWQFFDCPQDQRDGCPAFLNSGTPCWETFRLNGAIRESCRTCVYRTQALLPVGIST